MICFLLLWLQLQLMCLRTLHGCIGKRQGKRLVVVPGVPVVHVMLAEGLSGFTQHQVESRSVKVGEVHGHALGRAKAAANLLDGVAAAGLWMRPRAGDALVAVQNW